MTLPRWFKRVLVVSAGVLAIPLTAFIVLLFALAPDVSEDEVARAAAPGGKFDAILVETNGGATTSFGYVVYVIPTGGQQAKGSRVAFLYGAVRNRNAYGANLRWESPTQLLIEFMEAKSSQLERPSLSVAGQTVQVALRPGVHDASAPPGGMLYNIRGRK